MTNLCRLAVRLTFLVLGASILAGCMAEGDQTPAFYQSMARPNATVDSQTAAQMISQYRKNNGLGPVSADTQLTGLAKTQAVAMARAGSVKASLKGENALPRRMEAIGQKDVSVAENVSGGYRTLAEAFSGWRESPNHNAVLLHPDATRLGIATAYSPTAKHKVFWSLVMAGPSK